MSSEPPTSPSVDDLLRHAEEVLPAYLSDLRRLVDVDCGSFTPEGVNRVVDDVRGAFEARGWTTVRTRHQPRDGAPQLGDLLIARLRGSLPRADGGARVLLVGHTDTVFPEGTAAERPFRMEGQRAFGPGVSDMKGGLLAGMYAVDCLRAVGFSDFDEIVYACNPDEEIGSPFSGPHILELARDVDAAFVLEGARANGDIVSARKGVSDLRIVFHGRAAHAGVEPEKGRSAGLQAAHTTITLHALNGRWPGVTVNVGVIGGGTRPNVVMERCELQVDVRAPSTEAFEQALHEVDRVAQEIVVPDVTAELERRSGFPVMEKTPGTARLAELAGAIAGRLGFELRDAATGGASDANPIAGLGVPVLDGLGPVGGDDHSASEWLDVSSVPPRIALLAALVAGAGSAVRDDRGASGA